MDGELPGVEQLQIREHLHSCDCCRDEHESLLFTKRLLCGLKVKEPAETLETRIQRSISLEASRPAVESAAQTWLERAISWWNVLTYSHKLRYTVALTASSVVLATVVITPRALQKPEQTDVQHGIMLTGANVPLTQRDLFPPSASDRYRTSILPTYHDPAENPPPPNGTPVLIPVGADEYGPRVR